MITNDNFGFYELMIVLTFVLLARLYVNETEKKIKTINDKSKTLNSTCTEKILRVTVKNKNVKIIGTIVVVKCYYKIKLSLRFIIPILYIMLICYRIYYVRCLTKCAHYFFLRYNIPTIL